MILWQFLWAFSLLCLTQSQTSDEAFALEAIAKVCGNSAWLLGNFSQACTDTSFAQSSSPSYIKCTGTPRVVGTWIQVGGCPNFPTEIGLLTNLKTIRLTSCLAGQLPRQIGLLTMLSSLMISASALDTLPTQVGNLAALSTLTVDRSTNFSDVPTQIGLLSNLGYLSLSLNGKLTKIPTEIGNLQQLYSISLGQSSILELPTEIGKLALLESLYVDNTQLASLPTQIGLLTSMYEISLSGTPLSSLPDTLESLKDTLFFLTIRNANFASFPSVVTKLTGLYDLEMSFLGPAESYTIPTTIGQLTQLWGLVLNGNRLSSIPTEMGLLTALKSLYLWDNRLTTVPDTLKNCPITLFRARANQFSTVPNALVAMTLLRKVDLSDNFLSEIPPWTFERLLDFSVNNNRITSIPVALFKSFWDPSLNSGFVTRGTLNFANNLLTEIPTEIGNANITLLSFEGNLLTSIPSEMGRMSLLQELYLGRNRISSLPSELGQNTALYLLDMTLNALESLPETLGNLTNLSFLYLSKNSLQQFRIPTNHFGNLTELQLADNQLLDFGTIANITTLTILKLSGNKLSSVPILSSPLVTLDLSNNLLTDTASTFQNLIDSKIPIQNSTITKRDATTIGLGMVLQELFLSNNKLTGSIPTIISSLEALTILDMSYNELTRIVIPKYQLGGGSAGIRQYGTNNVVSVQPSGFRCSIPSSPNLLELDVSHNLIRFEVIDHKSLSAENGTFSCNPTGITGSGRISNPTYGVFISSPLQKIDLSYNYLNDTDIKISFFHNPLTEESPFIYTYVPPSLNLAGNRFTTVTGGESVCFNSDWSFGPFSPCITLPQDLDECQLGTHSCPNTSTCTDGYSPQMSYTCTCMEGYRKNQSTPLPDQQCIDIDECAEQYPCPSGFRCINTPGSKYCERDYLAMIITLPLFFFLLLLGIILFFICRRLYRLDQARYLDGLPDEVSWTWKDAIIHPNGWEPSGGFLAKELIPGSKEYSRANSLFSTLHFGSLEIHRVHAVYNKFLTHGFVATHKVQTQRFLESNRIFFATNWTKEAHSEQRNRVFKKFQATTERYPWNQDAIVILPVAHGTDLAIAERIAKTGFAALSAVDAGYYGKGIYFTSYGIYSFPYMQIRRQPALVISWILTGNPYPIIEEHDGPDNLMGAALKNGYQSHHVVTGRNGRIATDAEWTRDEVFDEFVLDQETQISPAYIIEIGKTNFDAIQKDWGQSINFFQRDEPRN